MIGPIVAWWVVSAFIGVAAAPIAWRLFPRLPDRGFGLARALGLLIAGYLLWLGASLGWVRNSPGGALFAVLAVAGAGVAALRGDFKPWFRWLREHTRTVAATEALFLVAFVAWALVRSLNPDIVATEKPMELAFLNAILRSPRFPPPDPWLSGGAISYYYLGYVLLAVPTGLTGVSAGVAFNLGNALWFALVVTGAYSVVFNLLGLRQGGERRAGALLGPLFVVITGNLGGVFEVMHSLHWFWQRLADGTMVSSFWRWLNLEDLARAPVGPAVFPPERFWFFWQASRVVNDIDLAGRHVEVIDEFPLFSFLLADNHPHVLALPFAILAVAVALHVFTRPRSDGFRFRLLSPSSPALRFAPIGVGLAVGAASLIGALSSEAIAFGAGAVARAAFLGGAGGIAAAVALQALSGREASALSGDEILLAGGLCGALAFLNTWDLPIYLALILAAAAWGSRQAGARAVLRRVGVAGVLVGSVAVLAVAPWLPTFASQAGGILPNLVFPTRLPQFLIMFAIPLIPASLWLIRRTEGNLGASARFLVSVAVGVPVALLAGSWILAAVIAAVSPESVGPALAGLGASSGTEVAAEALVRRLSSSWVAILLALILGVGVLVLRRIHAAREGAEAESVDVFPVLMILLGAALVLVPEFFYLKDSFGSRMNTVFKFYYAAWLLWGLAAAYVLGGGDGSRTVGQRAAAALSVLLLGLGLVYTTTALWDKTSHFRPPFPPTLDGTAHLDRDMPDDAAAIRWMRDHLPVGVVAEATGGSYTVYGRISAHTGFPTVLGWDFHEYQWRGDYAPQGSRAADIARLYQTRDWEEARAVLDRYGIRYVYVGPLERSAYPGLVTRKLDVYMDRLYESGEVILYGRRAMGSS